MDLNTVKKHVQRVLAVPFIRKSLYFINLAGYRILSLTKLLAVPFHLLFSRAFDREIFAFTKGVNAYYRDLPLALPGSPALRRNIHRLEKGLVMEPLRKVFATTYISETIDLYSQALARAENTETANDELKWAHDVLAAYFSAVDDSHTAIQSARERFAGLSMLKPGGSGKFAPYASAERSAGDLPNYEQFLALSRKRRSIRWFEDRPVPHEAIDKALAAALQAPSACNRQPFKYLVFDDPEKVRKVAAIPFGTSGYGENLPMIIVLVGDLSNYFSPRDRHIIYIDASLSAMTFMLALETLGLSSVPINWPDFGPLERKMGKTLGLKGYERPVMLLGVGYARADGKVPFSCKKSVEEIKSINKII